MDRTTPSLWRTLSIFYAFASMPPSSLSEVRSYYQQTFGTAMGFPVSVVVANLVMEDIEQRALSNFQPPPCFWKQYMDDTCVVLPANRVTDFHQHLSIETSIQFTVKLKKERKLPFLMFFLSGIQMVPLIYLCIENLQILIST